MIISFKDQASKDIFNGLQSKAARKRIPVKLWKVVHRKLDQLDSVIELNELKVPPGNVLEKLKDDRIGQYSIRINDQYRICFEWTPSGPDNIEIIDYH